MKLVLKIVIVVVLLFVLVTGGALFYLTRGLEENSQLQIQGIQPGSLQDGIFEGKHQGGRWSNTVAVTVENQKITAIEIIEDMIFVRPAVTDEILSSVAAHQNTNIDTITGATVSSKAYLKSIENALAR